MTLFDPSAGAHSGADPLYDFIGVGFGPSNLALAVAAREIDPGRRGVFFERRPEFDWHPGLLFDGSRMQISFLKDLATLRNPASPFSFLQYTQAMGRLEHFVNLGEFHPTRWEYRDYLRWVAEAFSEQVHYGSLVRKVTPVAAAAHGSLALFKVDVQKTAGGEVSSYWTRNVVYAAGGMPRYPAESQPGPNVIHSGEFLPRFPQRFAARDAAFRIGVLGDGQSAGEVLVYLLQHYPNARIELFIPGYALRPVDRSPFVNEAFFRSEGSDFHNSSEARRSLLRRELRNTNYGVLAPELIDQIYNADYLDSVKGVKRLFIHRFSRLVSLHADADGVATTFENHSTGDNTEARLDGIVLCTGYDRSLDPQIFADLLPLILRDDNGAPRLSEHYRVQTQPQIAGGLYVQGYGESSHGMSDTLLSLLPFRARDIFEAICREVPAWLSSQRLPGVEYPPKRHLESDPHKLYAVLERCRFATLISADGGEPRVTHVPLILDRSKGTKGVLFGHMDRANPHVEMLEGRKALALFHGPNAYISPHVYETDQLPTWNSITVHVRGTIRLLSRAEALVRGLVSISATDTRAGAYRLDPQHPGIGRLIDYIVGFELEIEDIIGRFKLSQDRSASDQRLAALELARRSEEGECALIEQALGFPLDSSSQPVRRPQTSPTADSDAWQLCIHELFEAQVSRSPLATAILSDDRQLTYAEINTQANQLAHSLRNLGVRPETIVGLCLDRSPELLVALLGILKAGAAFLPLDPDYPQDRLDYMLSDAASQVVVTQARLKDRFATPGIRVVCMDSDQSAFAGASTQNPTTGVSSRNVAYCIYTSGSTGRPKGVAMPHLGLVNHILHMKTALRHSASDRVLQFTAITADGSLQEIFTTWLTGATLVLPAEKAPSIRDFMGMLSRHRVSVVSIPTAYWHFWVGELTSNAYEWPDAVRMVILGGEKVIAEKFRQWRQLPCTRNVAWVQDYGPTETTVSCTAFEAAPEHGPEHLCIGRPNANMQVYILDPDGKRVPVGEVGELCITGPGLARGYWNRPDLTAQAFVPNPFGPPGSRLYRSGDLARYLTNGHLQFLERRDDQVKIRGHRVELGEIEGALLRCEGIRQAVVLASECAPGQLRLVAYLVAEAFDENRVRAHLARLLPQTMMPAAFIAMAALPSTASGKVDRAALRELTPAQSDAELEGATNLQRAVARWWAASTQRAPSSVDEDFFAGGGDSLRALQLLSTLTDLTGLNLSAADFFRERTVRGLAGSLLARAAETSSAAGGSDGRTRAEQHLLAQLSTSRLQPLSRLRREETQRRPASNAQQRLWFLDRLQQGTATYSVPMAYRITGAFSAARLDQCLTTLVARHEALRTALVMTPENELWQEIATPMEIRSRHLQAADLTEARKLAAIVASQPFDLAAAPLLRSVCIHIADEEVLWVLGLHHSTCDAWSVALVWRELMVLYAGSQSLPAPPFQYGDYAHWQRQWLSSPEADAHRTFWRERLAGELPPLPLGRLAVPDSLRSTAGAMEKCHFDGTLQRLLRDTAERHGTTEFVVLLSAFLATLHRFTRQEQILIGVPVACRSFADTQGIVGYFTNTLPLRIVFEPRMRFSELLRQTSEALAESLSFQELPFDQIVDALGAAREGSGNPLFQAMFVMQTTPLDGPLQLGAAQVREVSVHSGTSKVDMTCTLRATQAGLEGELEYSTDVLTQAQARRYVDSFQHLLSASIADSSTRVEELPMLSRSHGDDLMRIANSGFATYPNFRPVHVHFENQAVLTPQAIAIESGGAAIRYDELNSRANRLAHRLMGAGLGPESLVGICMDRSIGMATALLATLKAGAGFVPLDPDFPLDRLQAMADDARLGLIVTQAQYASRLERLGTRLLIEESEVACESAANPVVSISPDNLAYIYYTSGSTGTPKGVVLDHRGVMNRLGWLRRQYTLSEGDRVIHKTPLIFDLAIWEIFGPLMAGATILMAEPRAESDVTHIAGLLSTPRTVFVYFVPSMLEAFLNFAPRRSYPDLRWVAVTGEAVPTRLLERFNQHFPLAFHNIYGQTETSELALWEGSHWEGAAMIPIGRPIGIYRLFILDAALRPVPPLVPGEIYVAGVGGLARGYHGMPELTAEKFIPNPYATEPGERLYRTGDLGRLSEEGLMEYVGRTDNQVKIRGCRIETAEIEAVVSRHPAVHSCAAIVRNDAGGSPQLLAYVVGEGLSAAELGSHVEKTLPRYMLPSAYIFLEQVPLTASGKLDRTRLPAPRPSDFEARAAHAAPQSEVETELANIWKQVLRLESVGRTDNFFSLGGNSLKSIQVIARLKDEFAVDVRVRDFFNAPTVEGLASLVEDALAAYVASLSEEQIEQQLDRVRS